MRALFLVLFAASGAAGLVYEVAWLRVLSLVMGHTVAATSTVLAAFMGGLAAGAWLGGRAAGRITPRQALRAYAAIELTVAVAGALVPLAFDALAPLLSAAYASGDGRWFGAARLMVSLLVLALPTAAMGATLPFAARWFLRDVAGAGRDVGILYAANTVGAAGGAGATAFLLLPALGLARTTAVAVALNLAAAVGAALIARRATGHPQPTRHPVSTGPGAARQAGPGAGRAAGRTRDQALAALALTTTGFVALASEVAWTRALAIVLGPTTYAFGLMLTVFIAGIGAGAAAGGAMATRTRHPGAWLAALLLLFAGASAAATLGVDELALTAGALSAGGGLATWQRAALVAVRLAPAAAALGAAFPLAMRLAARHAETLARDAARLYAANTLGAIAGSFAAGACLIALLGLRGTLVTMAGAAALAAALLLVATASPRVARLTGLAASAALMAGIWLLPPWNPALFASGAYKYAPYIQSPDPQTTLMAGILEFYAEGAAGTVTVRRVAGDRVLAIDGKIDASDAADMLTQKLLAHLPLLLHPAPRQVGIIGLGSGVTAGAALAHDVTSVEVVELSPEVVAASNLFADVNGRPLDDPRTRLIVGDGRAHLSLTRQAYDVVISEPSNPWVAGVAALFTREFFEAVRDRLSPGGVFCQWTHTYDMSERDLRSIVATFAAVFPERTMWLVGGGDLLLIGGAAPFDRALEALPDRLALPALGPDLATVHVRDAASLLSLYVGGTADAASYGRGVPLQSDDRMALEYSAPASLALGNGPDLADELRRLADSAALPPIVAAARAGGPSDAWRARGQMHLGAEAFDVAYDAFARALALSPDDDLSADGLARAAIGAGRMDEAITLTGMLADQADAPVAATLAHARLLAGRGATGEAERVVERLVAVYPSDPRPLEQLAAMFIELGREDRLRPVAAELARRWPARSGTPATVATLRLLSDQHDAAIAIAEQAAARGAANAALWRVAGVAYATTGRPADARRALEASLADDPSQPSAYLNLALLELEAGRPDRALSRLGEALALDPSNGQALAALADALDASGARARAARVRAAAALR